MHDYIDYDLNKDGNVSTEEIQEAKTLSETTTNAEKADRQAYMAWVSLAGIIVVTLILLTPYVDTKRIEALSAILPIYFMSLTGIVIAFFGKDAFMTWKKNS